MAMSLHDLVCYTCGASGYVHALMACNKCKRFAVHRYCMNVIDLSEEIEWSCEYCEAKTYPVKQFKKVLNDINIREVAPKRKRDGEMEFCQRDENAALGAIGETGSSTTTSLDSDSECCSKKEMNPGLRLNGKRRKKKYRSLNKINGHVSMVEREPLLESDKNKVDCNKLDMAEKEGFVGETVYEEIPCDNIETDRIIQADQHGPIENSKIMSCYVDRDCLGNDRNCSGIQVVRPEQNVFLVTEKPAAIADLLLKSDSDARNMLKHSHIQDIGHECTVQGRSTGPMSLVEKTSAVQNSLDLASCETNPSKLPGVLFYQSDNSMMPARDIQIGSNSLGVSGDVGGKINKYSAAANIQIGGMNLRFSPTQPMPSAIVKSVHGPLSPETLAEPRINRGNCSTQPEPIGRRSFEQVYHDGRSLKVNTCPMPHTADLVRRPRDALNLRHGNFHRSHCDVQPKDVKIPNKSNSGRGANSKDLLHRQSIEPQQHNFGYIPAKSLFDFVWRGWFKVDETYCVQLGGHTSTTRPLKYKDISESLPQRISLEKICPCRHGTRTLTGRHLDMFFFPMDSRAEKMVDRIIEDMINGDYVLKFKTDDTELHISSSSIFPEPSRTN